MGGSPARRCSAPLGCVSASYLTSFPPISEHWLLTFSFAPRVLGCAGSDMFLFVFEYRLWKDWRATPAPRACIERDRCSRSIMGPHPGIAFQKIVCKDLVWQVEVPRSSEDALSRDVEIEVAEAPCTSGEDGTGPLLIQSYGVRIGVRKFFNTHEDTDSSAPIGSSQSESTFSEDRLVLWLCHAPVCCLRWDA